MLEAYLGYYRARHISLDERVVWNGCPGVPLAMSFARAAGKIKSFLYDKPVLSTGETVIGETWSSPAHIDCIQANPAADGKYDLYAVERTDYGGGQGEYFDLVSFKKLGHVDQAEAEKMINAFKAEHASVQRNPNTTHLRCSNQHASSTCG